MYRNLMFLLLLLFFSCKGEDESNIEVKDPNWSKEESINMNATFSWEEDQEIQNFLKHRPDWEMTKTGTGLRYFVYHKSENTDTAKIGDRVTVEFEISLLDGTQCYSSSKKGAESFVVEKSDIESGLHEGMQYLCTGDKAKFILPSHIAHGLVGDTEKIPPLSPVIYDITLIKVEKNYIP